MIVNSNWIKKYLKSFWPIDDIWLFDRSFFLLDESTIKKIITELSVKTMKYVPELWDCDNFSLLLNSDVKKYQYDCIQCSKPKTPHYPWAFGECIGTKFRGVEMNHSVNIAVCKDGIFFVDPQNNYMWKADRKNDDLYFIKI